MKLRTGLGLFALLLTQTAAAHVGIHAAVAQGGFVTGLAHPLLGADHLLAMLALGLWAAQTSGRAKWALPLAFVAAMGAGGALALSGVALPAIEAGVAASVLALGLLVAFAVRMPLAVGMSLAAAFALFHGHTHGSELPGMVAPAAYMAGFLTATATLLAIGVTAGYRLRERHIQAVGACVAFAGAALLAVA